MPRSRPKNWQSMAPGVSSVFLGFSGDNIWHIYIAILVEFTVCFFGKTFCPLLRLTDFYRSGSGSASTLKSFLPAYMRSICYLYVI